MFTTCKERLAKKVPLKPPGGGNCEVFSPPFCFQVILHFFAPPERCCVACSLKAPKHSTDSCTHYCELGFHAEGAPNTFQPMGTRFGVVFETGSGSRGSKAASLSFWQPIAFPRRPSQKLRKAGENECSKSECWKKAAGGCEKRWGGPGGGAQVGLGLLPVGIRLRTGFLSVLYP